MQNMLRFTILKTISKSEKKRMRQVTVAYTGPTGKTTTVTRHISETAGVGRGTHPAPEAQVERDRADQILKGAMDQVETLKERLEKLTKSEQTDEVKTALIKTLENLKLADDSLAGAKKISDEVWALYPETVEYV